MTYRLVVSSLAEKDFTKALNYYLDKSVSATEDFVDVVEEPYCKPKENPHSFILASTTAKRPEACI